MIDYGKRNLLGVEVDALDLPAAVERISYFAALRQAYTVSALAVHGVIESTHDSRLQAALNHFDMVLPDGQPVRWALNLLYGLDLPDKVPGPTVVEAMLARAAAEQFEIFFYGSTPATLTAIAERLDERYGSRLVIHSTPSRFAPVDRAEMDAIAATINASGARLCLVGLGCPRQERFVAALGPRLAMPSLAVGAAFDYLAGSINRAPDHLQRVGMEWAYRLSQDPRRLARRYFTTNSEFVVAVTRQLARQRFTSRTPAVPTPHPSELGWEVVDA